jgi:hypothetical protein
VDIGSTEPFFDREVSLDERVDNESPEFLLAERQGSVVNRVFSFDFS